MATDAAPRGIRPAEGQSGSTRHRIWTLPDRSDDRVSSGVKAAAAS
ncbi:hypothetical protein ACFVSU_17910 [Microbacterium sp. NPDC058062]